MPLLPLSLGVRRSPDAEGAIRPDRLPTKSEVEKVFARDAHTCRFCGFSSRRFQRVFSKGSSASDDGIGSFVTVCSFCELTLSLDRAGFMGGGVLIWLPELSQVELNHVVRALYVARASDTPLAAAASRALEVLTARRAESKKRIGTDDPLLLATSFLEEVDDATYAGREAKLEGLRFLPLDRYIARQGGEDVNIFPQMLSYWASPEGPYGKTPVSEWSALFDSVTETAKAFV